jgi:heat shock protein HslJ
LTTSELAGTAWTAFALEGIPEVVQPKPTLRWDQSMHLSGSGGCNAFSGAFALGKDSVRIGPLVPIGKACLTLPGAQEDKFFNALEGTRAAHLEGDQLVLLDEAGHQLARLLKNP